VQRTHGLVSTSEWTGVPLSTLPWALSIAKPLGHTLDGGSGEAQAGTRRPVLCPSGKADGSSRIGAEGFS
jgi:hypothetical protein